MKHLKAKLLTNKLELKQIIYKITFYLKSMNRKLLPGDNS